MSNAESIQLRNKFILLFAINIFIVIWVILDSDGSSVPVVNNTMPAEAATLMELEGTLVLDVREKDAFVKGHLPNALSIPIDELNKRLDEIHALNAEEIIAYCNDGSTRGPRATKQLNDAGFAKAKNLKGGAEGWEKASFQLVAN